MFVEKNLRNIIEEAYQKIGEGHNDEALLLLQEAHNAKDLFVQFAEEECDCFDFFEILSKINISVDLNLNDFLNYARKAYERVKRDGLAYKQYEAIRPILKQNISKLEELEAQLRELEEEFISGYLREIASIYLENDINSYYSIMDKISAYTNIHTLAGYLGAICDINYHNHPLLISTTFDALDDIYNRDKTLSGLVIFSYGKLLKYSDLARERLMLFKDTTSFETKGLLSNILFQLHKEHCKESWFEELLLSLINIPCSYTGAIDHIDFMLDDKEKEFIEKFLLLWIKNSDFNPHQNNLCKLFNSTSYKLIKDSKYLSELLVRFFNDDNKNVILSASDIASFHKLHSGSHLYLSIEELKKLNNEDIVYITRKVLSCVFDIELLCPFIMSIIYSIEEIDFRIFIIDKAFLPFVGYEYPHCINNFLNKEIEVYKDDTAKVSCIKNIIKKLEEYEESKEKLPPLKELDVPNNLVFEVRKAKHKRMSKITEESEKDSVLLKLMPMVPIKHGHSTFFFGESAYFSPSPMTSFSQSIDLPLSELFHPIASALDRYGFTIAKRGEK